jgi:Holliday junction resolvase RusA-like endonuclease
MPRLHGRAWERFVAGAEDATSPPPRSAANRRARRVHQESLSADVPALQILDDIRPAPAPRQTRRDAWSPRPCVLRYRAYADTLRMHRLQVPVRFVFVFYLPMPRSWSNRRRTQANGTPHTPKPDADNLGKACLDALVARDQAHWDARSIKLWAHTARIVIADAARCVVDDTFLQAHLPPALAKSRASEGALA